MSNDRRQQRKGVSKTAVIVHAGGATSFLCHVSDISEAGARIRVAGGHDVPVRSFFIDMQARSVHDAEIAWKRYPHCGLKLSNRVPLSDVPEEMAYLRKIWFAQAAR